MGEGGKSLIGLLFVMVVWAGSFIFIKIGLEDLSPYNLAFYRFFIASPILFLYVYVSGRVVSVDVGDVPWMVLLALSGVTLLYVAQFVALVYTTATNASILINTSVIFIAIISYFYGEKFSKLRIAGVAVSFFGVMLILSKGNLSFFSNETFIGDVLMIINGLLWATYTLIGKKLLEKYSPEVLTAYVFVIGSVLLFPFAVYEGFTLPSEITINAWVSILYLAVLCSVFAYVIWYMALENMDATKVAVFIYLIPLFTAIMAFFILDERIDFFTVVGGVMTMIGVYLTERY
jgi:drug/metabolite transporter (DMT)-like permease